VTTYISTNPENVHLGFKSKLFQDFLTGTLHLLASHTTLDVDVGNLSHHFYCQECPLNLYDGYFAVNERGNLEAPHLYVTSCVTRAGRK
jgi:hypothetical protein